MTVGKAGMAGHAPAALVRPTERAKYEAMWGFDSYRKDSPGEKIATIFLQQAKPKRGEAVIDFGCGTGRGGLMLYALGGLKPIFVDFADNALDPDIKDASAKDPDKWQFVRHDLTKFPMPVSAKYGYCVDVLEHIPPDDVGVVLKNILRTARHCFFSISTVPDHMGALIGEPLHLTVQPYSWWLEQFRNLDCSVHWSHEADGAALFYVTAFATGKDLEKAMVVNVEDEQIYQNVIGNLRLGLTEVSPHDTQDVEIMLLAGGPSLADFEDEIREKRAAGMPLVTVNGTYNWALERGLKPSAQVMVDAREFNKRFLHPITPGCKYLLSSQCHPDAVASVPKDQVWLWHAGAAPKVRDAIDEFVKESGADREWYPIYGGSTVVLRAIPLLRTLGFAKFHIYGMDSCLNGKEHHAYAQPENDAQRVVEVEVGGRTFVVTPWMWSQAQEFMDLTRAIAEVCDLAVYGDGLIAHIIKTCADLPLPDKPNGKFGFADPTT